jgi:hypothetical protein
VCSDADEAWGNDVEEGETGKKAKATPHAGGKSVSGKSQATDTTVTPARTPLRNHPVSKTK